MINKEINILFDSWIKENKENILKKWIDLAKIPSIKAASEKEAPFGVNCKKALKKATSYFENEGFECKINDNNSYSLCSYGNGEKKIGLFSHSDVVPVGDDWIYTKPFEPVVIENTLIGRGVEDNKSGIMAAFCVFSFLKNQNIHLNNKLELFIGSDEECGMEDMKDYLKEERIPDVSLVPDADFPCSVGEKGICHLMTESESCFDSIVSINGGQAYNIVLDSVEVVVPYSEKTENEIIIKIKDMKNSSYTKDDNEIKLIIKGVAKHASIPEGSVNAALLAAEFLLKCDFVSGNDKKLLTGAKELLSCYYGKGLGISHIDPVFGKTTCVNGLCRTKDNKLHLSFDIRYGDTVDGDELEKNAENNIIKNGFIVVEKDNRPGFYIEDEAFPSIFENIYEALTGERLGRVTMAGGTYARKLKNAFSTGTSVITKERKTSVFNMPDGHGGAHQCDECIDIEGFFLAVKILLNYIFACDKML